jgi:hypothetical protein
MLIWFLFPPDDDPIGIETRSGNKFCLPFYTILPKILIAW